MAKIKKYSDKKEKITSAWNDKGDKRYGFVSKDSEGGRTRYGVGIDNMGDPYRGIRDEEIRTPLGTVDYGYDGDTVYGGFTPNVNAGGYSDGGESGRFLNLGNTQFGTSATPYGDREVYVDRNGRNLVNGGILGFDDGTLGIGGGVAFPARQSSYNEIDTPLGLLAYGKNADTREAYANFTPDRQYYIQALANLLRGR